MDRRFSGNAKQRRVQRRRHDRMVTAMVTAIDKRMPWIVDQVMAPLPLVQWLMRDNKA